MGHTVKNEYIDSFTIYGLSVCLVISLSILNTLVVHKPQPSITVPSIEQHPKKIVFDPHVFENIQLQARAYVIYDLTNHKIIAGNHETVMLPLASITKVMTAVSSTIHKSKEDSIVITPISIEGDYDIGLKNHQVWKLVELLKYTLVFSSNDGAESVADSFGGRDFFVRQMNIDAKNLGLNFIFTDINGTLATHDWKVRLSALQSV